MKVWLLCLLLGAPLVATARNTQPDTTAVPAALQAFFQRVAGITLTTEDPLHLYAEVQRWHKTPYGWGRNVCQQATDCSGFTGKVYEQLTGLKLGRAAPDQWPQCTPVHKDSLRTGDLVFFAIGQSRISHVGIYLKDHKFIHASSCCGVIVEDLRQAYYVRWWYGAGRPILPQAPATPLLATEPAAVPAPASVQ
jgi:cell wall-associated NlpC family hydrolase